ncbi:MAG: tryptophan synthase subunit alpha [Bacteroidota bacterium]|nr:tryptophan synthase subunit alpha [Bacteroidota bacterium]
MDAILKSTNRLDHVFQEKKKNILSVYFTAGFPQPNATLEIMQSLQESGADIIEVGIPYSDPVADGPTIQDSNMVALENGMSLRKLMHQLKEMRRTIDIPVILMGYLNPVIQYGMEKFCKECEEIGVDGLILPDLPMAQYLEEFKSMFESHGLYNIFLISPQTNTERIHFIDKNSNGFIYVVSSASITGAKTGISTDQIKYFEKIQNMNLKNPKLIGFGISNNETFSSACKHAEGAIIGSAFIRLLAESKDLKNDIKNYITAVKGN